MDAILDTIMGLPVHPLVVHAVVVLLPLSAIGAVVMVVRPSFSRRCGVLVVGVAAAGAVAAFLARESGERLALRVGVPGQHAELGDTLPWVALAYLVVLAGFWLVDRGIPSNRSRPWWLRTLAIVLILVAAWTTVLTVRTGHTGAEATWAGVAARS